MEPLPQLSNEDQLWIMSQVRDKKMTIDQAWEHVKQKASENAPSTPNTTPQRSPSLKKTSSESGSPSPIPKKKMSFKGPSFFGEGKVKEIPADAISAPIIPIDPNGGSEVPRTNFDPSFQDIKKKGDEERLKILDLVKSGQMTIDDALKYADDAGLSSSAQREADTIADTTSAVLEQKVYNFPVYKAGKVRAQVRRIIQIDFKNRNISSIQRGNVGKKYTFSETTGYETDEGVHFTIMFTDDHDMDYDADSPEERYEICRLVSIILKLNKADIRTEQDYWRELPKLQAVMKEGELEKKGGGPLTAWTKRWVRVRRGECSYYRPGEQTALNIVQLAEGTTAITKLEENGFMLIGKVKRYVFRIPAGERSLDQQRWERDQWIKVLLQASHNEVVKPPSGALNFVRPDDSIDESADSTTPTSESDAAPRLIEKVCQGLRSLKVELMSFNITDDVMSHVDDLVALASSIRTAPPSVSADHYDYKRPSRFISPSELMKEVDEKLDQRASGGAGGAPVKPPRKQQYAETSIEQILVKQGIDPSTGSKAPIGSDDDRIEYYIAPPLPDKKRASGISVAASLNDGDRMSNLSGTSVTPSRLQRVNERTDESGYIIPPSLSPLPAGSVPEEAFDVPPKPVPVPRKSLGAKQDHIAINPPEESSPGESKDGEDDKPMLRDKLRLSTFVPQSTKGRSESASSDCSDGVHETVREFEEMCREVEDEKRKIPHKGTVQETGSETVVIAAPPPAPFLPPPPPILPGFGSLFSSSKKLKRTAKTKLKAFHWDQVPKNLMVTLTQPRSQYNKSLWKKMKDLTDIIDHQLLEEKFAEDKITATKVPTTGNAPERKLRTLLDPKRAQNLGIVLAGLKMTSEQLQTKLNLIKEEDGPLPVEQIAMLRRLQPTPDDIEMYRAYKGKPEDLESADQFMMQLADIPQLSIRLDILNDIMELPVQYADMKPSVDKLQKALVELLEAKRFVRVLEYILAVGNYMNSGAGKPAVDGFQLVSLTKLCASRSRDKNYTLLHYLVQFLSRSEPDLLRFYTDMGHVNECADLSIAGLSAEVEVMKGYLTKIQKKAKSLKKIRSSALENRYQQDIHSFVSENEKLLKELSDQCTDVAAKFKRAMELYGEPADRSSEEIFPPLSEFLTSYQRLVVEQDKRLNKSPGKAMANILFKGGPPNPAMLKKNISTVDGEIKEKISAEEPRRGSPDKPTKEGYLEKLSGGKHRPSKWDRRFFEISATGYLHYYKKQFDKNLGSIYLKDCSVTMDTDEEPAVIVIDTDDRDFKLRAKSPNEADDWFNTLVYYGERK